MPIIVSAGGEIARLAVHLHFLDHHWRRTMVDDDVLRVDDDEPFDRGKPKPAIVRTPAGRLEPTRIRLGRKTIEMTEHRKRNLVGVACRKTFQVLF